MLNVSNNDFGDAGAESLVSAARLKWNDGAVFSFDFTADGLEPTAVDPSGNDPEYDWDKHQVDPSKLTDVGDGALLARLREEHERVQTKVKEAAAQLAEEKLDEEHTGAAVQEPKTKLKFLKQALKELLLECADLGLDFLTFLDVRGSTLPIWYQQAYFWSFAIAVAMSLAVCCARLWLMHRLNQV